VSSVHLFIRITILSFRQALFWREHLAPWSRVLLEELMVSQLVKKLLLFFGTTNYITVLKRICHLFQFWARQIQFTLSTSIYLRSTLILPPSTPRSSKWYISFTFYDQNLYALLLTLSSYMLTHLIPFDSIILIIFGLENYNLLSFSLCIFSNLLLRGCIQTFPDRVNNEIYAYVCS